MFTIVVFKFLRYSSIQNLLSYSCTSVEVPKMERNACDFVSAILAIIFIYELFRFLFLRKILPITWEMMDIFLPFSIPVPFLS